MYVSKNGTANNTLKGHYNALLHSVFKHYCSSYKAFRDKT